MHLSETISLMFVLFSSGATVWDNTKLFNKNVCISQLHFPVGL